MDMHGFLAAIALSAASACAGLAFGVDSPISAGGGSMARVQFLREGWRFADDPGHEGEAKGFATNFPSATQPTEMPFAGSMMVRGCSSAWLALDFAADLRMAADDRVYLELGGVNYRCRGYLNGELLGVHDGGCGSFAWDVTERIRRSGLNRVVLNVEVCPRDGTLDGLKRNQLPALGLVWIQEIPKLVVRPAAHLTDVFVRTDPTSGVATVRMKVRNDGRAARIPLRVGIGTKDDDAVLDEARREVELPVGESELTAQVRVKDVRLWSVNDPRLYRVKVSLGADERTLRVGYRTMRVDDEGFFTLNGKRIFIKSCHTINSFPDAPFVNLNTDRMRCQLLYFKACGFNAIRYLISTAYPEMMDLCDEIGLMVYEEHPYSWLRKSSDRTDEFLVGTCRTVLERDRNHASLTMFGLLNETKAVGDELGIVEAADRALAALRPLAPDMLFFYQSGRWDGQLARASASNPGSTKWDAWMGDEGSDRDMTPHSYPFPDVGDVHFYPSHPVEGEGNRTLLEKSFTNRRASFMSEGGCGSQANMVTGYLKFDMYGWKRSANNYDCVREHALGFRRFFEEWRLHAIWPTPEEFVADSQAYEARQRSLLTAMARRNPRISGYSVTMGMDKDYRGEGLTDADGSFKRGTSDMLQACCSDLMFCIIAHDSCVFDTEGATVEVSLSDFGVLRPGVKYPIRLRITSERGVEWERRMDFSVRADAKGNTPTASVIFSGTVDTRGWPTGDYVLSAEFLEGAYATCGTKTLHVIAADESRGLLSGRPVVFVGTNRTACAQIVSALGGKAVEADVSTLNGGDTAFVMPGSYADDEVAALVSAAERGARVVVADAASLIGADGKLRIPFASGAAVHKEWNWLYHYDAIVHRSPLTAGVKNRMICDTEYFGDLWSDRCVRGLPPPDAAAFSCVYIGIGDAETAPYYDGLLLGEYRVGDGAMVLNTLRLAADDPVALRVYANVLGAKAGDGMREVR